ncbi:MAG TPA: prepilin-type N-terminal cleavage/methylation domain-containing protein [Paenibacillus sp.]|jgi:prepilin-type N-terminal cleavage/methylation domain-containing protein
MTKYVKRIRGEQGFTLIELIASLTILTLVVGIIYSVTMFGLRSYHKVQIENSLREEADILMSSIISELYVFGPENVSQTESKGDRVGDNSSLLELKRMDKEKEIGREILMDSGKLYIRDIAKGADEGSNTGEILVQSELIQPGSEVRLTCSNGKLTCSSGLIEIKLVLEQTFESKDYQLELNSRFGF